MHTVSLFGYLLHSSSGTGIAADAQLLVSTGGTVTGGKFKVVIEYAQGDNDGSGRHVAGGTKG